MSRTWLITGSSRGLGRALAQAVLAAGDNLFATARNARDLEDLAAQDGSRLVTASLDVTDFTAARRAVETVARGFGRLDVVVNAAGYGNLGAIEDTTMDDIRAQIETNLFGAIHVSKAAIPLLRAQRGGHIVHVSSVGGRIGATGRAAYSAAKFGLEGFAEAMAIELAPHGVRVTLIEPGGFRTDFAGASTTLQRVRAEYDSTVGAAARFQRAYNGNQPGDPARAAQVILQVVGMPHPPLRLLLGSDAVSTVEARDLRKIQSDRAWRDVSLSTDFISEVIA